MEAELLFCHELRLMLRVTIGDFRHIVEYDGRALCREQILVDGDVATWRFKLNTLPSRLEFSIGVAQATFERKFVVFAGRVGWSICRLTINGELVFHEERLDTDASDDSAYEAASK